MITGVPLRGVRLGVLVPVAETAEEGGIWGNPFKRGGSAEEGLVGLMMVISGGGALAADESDAIFPFGFGAQLILVRKKCIWKAHKSNCFYPYLRIFVYIMWFGMEFRRLFRAAVWRCVLLCV